MDEARILGLDACLVTEGESTEHRPSSRGCWRCVRKMSQGNEVKTTGERRDGIIKHELVALAELVVIRDEILYQSCGKGHRGVTA